MNRIHHFRRISVIVTVFITVFVGIASPCALWAEELDGMTRYMKMFGTDYTIGSLTPTVCDLMEVKYPEKCTAPTVAPVVEMAKKKLDGRKIERALIFCGDAIGETIISEHPEMYQPIADMSDYRARCTCVMQSVTPVSFSTIFTGAPPEVHGIQVYKRPVQKTDTIFDAYVRAGKRVAIISVAECSVGLIFKERPIDYHQFNTDEEAFQCAKKIVADPACDYDLIVVYDGGYDSTMHRFGTRSPQALAALARSAERYQELVALTEKHWTNLDCLTVFLSDHGSHDNENGKGTHGTEMKDDMLLNHFYKIQVKK
ncbi:MAG: alkaline phosphatase family protein [Planctomycetia bacterium]|nr:alkaline phosphatase family protein [Planctomycetia bacterium]